MKKEKLLLIGIVVAVLLALVTVGTVLGQEGEEPEELPPQPNPAPEVPVDEGEEGGVLPAAAVDPAFSYQGRLTDSGGSPVSDGDYDFEVQFWDDPDPTAPGALQVGATIAASDTVSNGLFELTLPVTHWHFNGRELYLRMRVSADGGTTWDDWTDTQPILAVPYALSLRPGATIGGTGAGNGSLWLADSAGRLTYNLNGYNGFFTLGASGVDGDLAIRDGGGQTALLFDGDTAQLTLGDEWGGNPGDLVILDNGGTDAIRLEGTGMVYADGGYYCGRSINDAAGTLTEWEIEPCLWDDRPADFAEVLAAAEGLGPGDVLVIGPDGKLASSTEAYQPTVVGVYTTRPSYVGSARLLGQPGYAPLAVVGIVPTKASAENGPIAPGDLLVASATPGHAMRCEGVEQCFGRTIGKALGALEEGTGVIDVLVMLQ